MFVQLFFGLYGVIADKTARAAQFPDAIASVMVEQYGGTAIQWAAAYRDVLADWDSYYDDLNLSGDDGIAAMWEGAYRTTRALFRLSAHPEPAQAEITALSRTLNGLAASRCDLIPPDAKNALKTLYTAGFTLGIASLTTASEARGVLDGAGVADWFAVSPIAPELVEQFERDSVFYTSAARHANVDPAACWVIDTAPDALEGARSAGMQITPFAGDWDTLVRTLLSMRLKSQAT